MTDHVLAGLVRRRAEMAGELHTIQGRLNELHADLAALDAVIRQFDPEYHLDAIRPRYRRAPTAGEHGAISRTVLDVLRRAEGSISAKAIAEAIIALRALDAGDRALARSMRKRVDMALRYQRTNGMVREGEQTGAEVVWEVVR